MTSIPVYNPLGGRFLLLQWWTYDDRGHVVLARKKQSLLTVVDCLIDKHTDAEIKAYLDIEIVAPSNKLCELAAIAARNLNISVFHDEVARELVEAMKLGFELPAPFSLCDKYEPEDDVDNDDWAKEYHYDCRNCKNTIAFGGLTSVELFDRYHDKWLKIRPPRTFKDKRVPSRADTAKDNELIWYARANFGHHAGGIELAEVDFGTAEHFPPADVLFFFRQLESFDTSKLNERFQLAQAELKEQQKKEEVARRMSMKERARRQAEVVMSFFNE